MIQRFARFARTQPLGFTLLACAAASALFAAAFAWLYVDRGQHAAAATNAWMLTWAYWLPMALAWAALTRLACLLWKAPPIAAAPTRQNVIMILAVAAVLRLFVVFAATPQLSDDLWRYVHDGATLAAGGSPYAQAPIEVDPLPAPPINHPHLVTIYQPTSQWCFALLATLGGGERAFRLGFVALDLMVIGLLLVKLRDDGRSAWWSVLYAWHPLPISEIAGSGHQEPLGIALLIVALMLVEPARPRLARSLLSGAALVMAAAVKPVVLPLILPLTLAARRRPAAVGVIVLGLLLAGAALYVPFAALPGGLGRMAETARIFLDKWAFNSPIHGPLANLTGSRSFANDASLALLLATLVTVMVLRADLWRTAVIYLLAALLLSSTVHPWYLLWALALTVPRWSWTVWVWSLTIGWSYAALVRPRLFEAPWWVRLLEFAPVFAVMAWELSRLRRAPAPSPSPP